MQPGRDWPGSRSGRKGRDGGRRYRGSPDRHLAIAALAHFATTALAISMVCLWLGWPAAVPPSPLATDGKLSCISYAPFRDGQDPLVPGTKVSAEQIDQDLTLLSRYTDCIRTYSNANGLDQISPSPSATQLEDADGALARQ